MRLLIRTCLRKRKMAGSRYGFPAAETDTRDGRFLFLILLFFLVGFGLVWFFLSIVRVLWRLAASLFPSITKVIARLFARRTGSCRARGFFYFLFFFTEFYRSPCFLDWVLWLLIVVKSRHEPVCSGLKKRGH